MPLTGESPARGHADVTSNATAGPGAADDTTRTRRGARPVAVDSFVGRDAEVRQLRTAVGLSRLVTVSGTGGIGKSRLAGEVAMLVEDEYADGCHTVSLAVVRCDDEVAEAVGDTLRLSPVTTGSLDEQLVTFFADKQMLLVIDSCEHLLVGCRRLLAGLLAAAPGVRMIATSREPLGIAGERVIALRPLSAPDPTQPLPSVADMLGFGAVRLLEDRAVAVQGRFRLDASNLAAAVQLTSRLDGLPLAIELAASRLRSLSLAELTDRLDDRFAMLTGGDPTARSRHRTLRAMVEWSWDLCSPREQRLWTVLPAFSGGADLEAISAVACAGLDAAGYDILDDLDGLVSKSVVSADTTMRRGRYTMIETMDAFGRERAHEFFPAPDDLATRHAQYYLSLAERGRDGFYTPDQLDWTRRLRQERANLAIAFDHLLRTDPPAALRLATALRFHWLTGPLREGRRWLDDALAVTDDADVDRLEGLLASSWVAVAQGDRSRATSRAAEATQLAALLDRPEWTRRARVHAAIAAQLSGELQVADREFSVLIDELDSPDDLEFLLLSVALQVLGCLQLGRPDRARAYFTQLSELCQECGEIWIKLYALAFYSFGAWLDGNVDEAADAAAGSLRVKLEFADALGSAMLLGVLGAVAYHRDQPERAAEIFGHTAAVNRAIGATAEAYSVAMNEALMGVIDGVQGALGADAFDEAFARGGQLTAAEVARLPATSADGGPRPLSDREYEVATLVSQGLSNRKIAERLVLSPRTIDGHLERIFDKLGVRSRAAVSTWVATRADTD